MQNPQRKQNVPAVLRKALVAEGNFREENEIKNNMNKERLKKENGIKIDKLRDVLIIEKSEGNVFLKGAKVYCGCCGNTIGEMKKKLTMPFKAQDFLDALKDKSVEWMRFGLRHKKCRHSMFPFQNHFDFITLDNYNKNVNRDKV